MCHFLQFFSPLAMLTDAQVHRLFITLRLTQAFVTKQGRLVGVVSRTRLKVSKSSLFSLFHSLFTLSLSLILDQQWPIPSNTDKKSEADDGGEA